MEDFVKERLFLFSSQLGKIKAMLNAEAICSVEIYKHNPTGRIHAKIEYYEDRWGELTLTSQVLDWEEFVV